MLSYPQKLETDYRKSWKWNAAKVGNGRYVLLEFKLGSSEINEGAKHLCEIERLIKEHNEKEKQMSLRLPDLKIVITGTEYGYRREDGVLVIPIGCLKD